MKKRLRKMEPLFCCKKIPAIKAGNNLCSRGWNCNIIARTIFLPQYSIWLFRLLVFSNGSPMNTNTISLICFLLLVDSDNTIPVAISLSQHNTWSVSAIMVPVVRYCVVIVLLQSCSGIMCLAWKLINIRGRIKKMVNRFLMFTPYSAVMMITSPTSSTISSVVSMFLPTDLSSTIYISPACAALSSAQFVLGDGYVVIRKQYALHLYRHF